MREVGCDDYAPPTVRRWRREGKCEKGTEMEQDGREKETTGKEVKGRRQGAEGTLPANQPSSRPNLF